MNCLKCNKTITKKMLRSQQVIFSSMSHSLDEDLDDEMHSGTFCNHKCFDEFMNYNKYRIISNPKTLSVKVLNFRNDYIDIDLPNKAGFNQINKFLEDSRK